MTSPLTLVRNNPLTLQAGATQTISTSGNLDTTDTSYGDAQLTYTIVSGPSDGVLLDNGVAATSFRQADLDNGLVSYHEAAAYPQNANIFSDQFVFDVSDPGGNQINNTQFQIFIDPSYPVTETAPTSLTVFAGLSAPLTVQLAYTGYNNEKFTTVVEAKTGTLFAYGPDYPVISNQPEGPPQAQVSGSGSNDLTITGSLASVKAALETLHYVGTTGGADTITITTTDLGDQSSITDNVDVIVEQAGNFTSLDDPLDMITTGTVSDTYAYGINDEGQIVGHYIGSSGQPFTQGDENGFLYQNQTFTVIANPAEAEDYSNFFAVTAPDGINDFGQIVGYQTAIIGYQFGVPIFAPAGGFLYSGGLFTTLAGPASAINNQGEVVGYYYNQGPEQDTAYIYQNGSYQGFGPNGTMPFGVNNEREVVGTYEDQSGNSHGFIYSNGTFSLINAPSALQTDARGINDTDIVVGYYENNSGTFGFAYNETTGEWTPIVVPGATATYVYGINGSDQIVGDYVDADGDTHGFIGPVPPPFPATAGNNDEWILSDGQWLASAEPGSHPSGYGVAAVGDFTDSGTDGILWYDASTGDVDEWKLSDGAWAGSIDLGTHPGNYQIAGVGVFTGDGTDDVLWTGTSSGQVQTDIWELNNGQWAASVSPGSHPAGYQVAGIGDWTGNGTDGILWYDSSNGDVDEWQLSNGQWAGSVDLGSHPANAPDGASYQIAGIGDFTGNGIDDVLWTSVNSDGTVATDIWELGSNGQWINSVSPGSHPAGSQVVGIGDFTGNGTSDILWQNPATGDVDEWLINNDKWAGSIDLGTHPGSHQIAGIGDFTGSGTSGILWHSNT